MPTKLRQQLVNTNPVFHQHNRLILFMYEQSARGQLDLTSPSLVQEKSLSSSRGSCVMCVCDVLVTCSWVERGKRSARQGKVQKGARCLFYDCCSDNTQFLRPLEMITMSKVTEPRTQFRNSMLKQVWKCRQPQLQQKRWRKALKCLPPPCTAHLHNRLLCRHDIDHVSNDEHIESYVVSAKHETAP